MDQSSPSASNPLLFSIDVEDLLARFPLGEKPNFQSHVPQCMDRFLEVFNQFQVKITCFICGDLARQFPDVIRKIELNGHEIACHSDLHMPLDLLTPSSFKIDLENNIRALRDAGVVGEIKGYRAPIFSLTEQTSWAYDILSEMNFKYSSSVLPAANPQYGWKDFGTSIRKFKGIYEIPMTLGKFFGVKVPLFGGMYLRWLPNSMMRSQLSLQLKKSAVLGFIHPYDIDVEQEYFRHPGIDNLLFHALLFYRRGSVLPRLKEVFGSGVKTSKYIDYVNELA